MQTIIRLFEGFLKTSNQQSNFGLLDVIAALHWVRENADSFGGDRNRITLLGYRTGAVVANLLLVAQIAKGTAYFVCLYCLTRQAI
jgi:carboxylesterase type B